MQQECITLAKSDSEDYSISTKYCSFELSILQKITKMFSQFLHKY